MLRRALPVIPSVALLTATLLVPWTHFGETTRPGDIARYRSFAEAMLDGRIPYRDFFMEYPPGSIPVFLAPELTGHRVDDYVAAFQWLVFGLTLATIVVTAFAVAALGGSLRRTVEATCFVAIAPALLGSVYYLRSDIWPALITSVTLLAMLRRRDGAAAGLLGIGAAAKFYPVLLLPLLVARAAQREGRRGVVKAVGIFTAVFVLVVGPLAMIAPGGVGYSFRTQLTRALEVESLGATIALAAHQVGLGRPDVGAGLSYELEGALPQAIGALQTIALVALVVLIWIVFYRSAPNDETLLLAVAATIATVVALNRVLSPQYLVWLVPVMALVGGRVGTIARGLLATAMILTVTYFPGRFRDFRLLGSSAWIVLVRDLVLVALAALLIQALRTRSRVGTP
jgi:hypothetical protein